MADGNGNLPANSGLQISCPPRLLAQGVSAAREPYDQTLRAPQATITAARQWLPSLRRAAEPATPEERVVILVGLANVTGKPDVLRNGAQAAQLQFWRIYHELLGHLPAEVLRRATMAFLRAPSKQGDKWFPDPGTLLEFARKDEAYANDLRALRGLERLALAKPEEPRSYIGTAPPSKPQENRMSDIDSMTHVEIVEAAKSFGPEERAEARKALFDLFAVDANKLFSKLAANLITMAGQTETQARNEVIGMLTQMAAGEACRVARAEGREPDHERWRTFTDKCFSKACRYTSPKEPAHDRS